MATLSSAEVSEKNVALMGPTLGPIYTALWNEVAYLHQVWHQYKELFGTKPSRVDLLNEAAGGFFRIVHDTVWEQVLLCIARLLDKPSVAGKNTLTVRRLADLMPDETKIESVRKKVDEAMAAAQFARDWRNRKIAHNSLELILNPRSKPLATGSRVKVDAALLALSSVLNEVQQHFDDSETAFDRTAPALGSGLDLLHLIHGGLVARRQRIERARSGNGTRKDLMVPDL